MQAENNLYSSAEPNCRCGTSWESHRETFQASSFLLFFPRALPWAVIALHLRREEAGLACGGLEDRLPAKLPPQTNQR